jgi:small GTP-binding protein
MNEDCGLSPRKLIRLTIVGDHKIGKTTILNSLVNIDNYPFKINTTTSPEMYIKLYNINNILYRLHIWDTMGHTCLIPLNRYCYQNIDCLIIVFDVSNKNSFNNVEIWYERFIENTGSISKNNMPLLILLGNNQNNKLRIITEYDIELLSKKYNMIYYELCANNIKSVDTSFQQILNDLITHLFEPKETPNIIDSCCTSPRQKLIKDTTHTTKKNNNRSCFTKCFFSD